MKRVICFRVLLLVFCVGIWTPDVLGKEMAQESVYKFVMQEYDYGVPCDQARAFGSEAIDQLTSMLQSSDFEPYWENIVVSLGCIGDPAAVKPLNAFLEQHHGKISFDVFAALQGVPTALGFISQKGDHEAMRILSKMADEAYWEKAQLQVFDNIVVDNHTINKNLMKSTIVALGTVGTEQSRGTLKLMKLDPSLDEDYSQEINNAIGNH